MKRISFNVVHEGGYGCLPPGGKNTHQLGCVANGDNRGGWKQMVEHGKTGWLCDSPEDFIKYASLMAQEPEMRREMSDAARKRGRLLGGEETARKSWEAVFEKISSLNM